MRERKERGGPEGDVHPEALGLRRTEETVLINLRSEGKERGGGQGGRGRWGGNKRE